MRILNRRGIYSIAIIVLLSLVSGLAYAYWRVSSQELYTIYQEAEKLKAINLAESGLNLAISYLTDSYYTYGSTAWPIKVPSLDHPKIKRKFENGYFEIEKIGVVEEIHLEEESEMGVTEKTKFEKVYSHLPYTDGYNTCSGYYDIYEVVVRAEVKGSGVGITMRSFVKTIQLEEK